MSILIYAVAIVMWILLCTWTWNSAKLFENNKTKVTYIAIGVVIMAILTFIIFSISKAGVSYPNDNMVSPIRNMLLLIFIPVNGFFVMPYLAMQFGKLNSVQIKKPNFRKKIITIIAIFIIVLIIECSYFKSIQNGMMVLDNNWYVTGIKVEPKNIFILDQQTQNNIIFNFRNFYNSIDYEFWLIVADRPVDINLYMSELQLQFDNAPSQAVRKLISQDINKAESFMTTSMNVVDTEYFIMFRDKKLEICQKRIQTLISNLASLGLVSRQTSDDDLKFLLQNFLNGGAKNEFGTVMSNV